MKGRLQRAYWLGIFITLLMTIAALFLLVKLKVDDTRTNLRAMLHTASAWTMDSGEDLQSMAEAIAAMSPPVRVTFLMSNGLVLADSHADALSMDAHAERAEIVRAADGGIGESFRISSTQATFVFYVAEKISPNLILRLSCPINEITRMLIAYAIGLVVLFSVLYLLQRWMFRRFSGEMLRQMDDVRLLLEGDMERRKSVFPELQPAMNNIAYRAERLQQDLDEVKRTLNLRSDFVANASHELRSPLTSVMGFAEMLDEDMVETEEEKKLCTGMILSECRRMLGVIEDILQLSRAERQTLEDVQEIDVAAIARQICQALAPRAAQRSITLDTQGEMTARGTEKAFWEILYNLIDNAIHYGRDGGHVRVQLSPERIVVEDDGVGISEEHLPHLFEQFYRVDETRSLKEGGSGLGLSIVQALVTQLGAKVRAESQVGRGSRFIVDFGKEECA